MIGLLCISITLRLAVANIPTPALISSTTPITTPTTTPCTALPSSPPRLPRRGTPEPSIRHPHTRRERHWLSSSRSGGSSDTRFASARGRSRGRRDVVHRGAFAVRAVLVVVVVVVVVVIVRIAEAARGHAECDERAENEHRDDKGDSSVGFQHCYGSPFFGCITREWRRQEARTV
ncbi:hypothetical protein GGR51DRAFT_75848 [Nemania sp. FL0031]|nr:hypothetical protein GGR51DRAFT_75848 [Nemania sp. FL0031]